MRRAFSGSSCSCAPTAASTVVRSGYRVADRSRAQEVGVAQVFMGDTGSLSLGGIIAVLALAVRKELMIPLLCGIFLIELCSVMLQVSYFKYTKKKYGEGRRILLMSPLHHHYQKKNIHEAKIVARFWIIGILLAIVSLATLKLN